MLEGGGPGQAEAVSLSLLAVQRIPPESTREGPPLGPGDSISPQEERSWNKTPQALGVRLSQYNLAAMRRELRLSPQASAPSP